MNQKYFEVNLESTKWNFRDDDWRSDTLFRKKYNFNPR